MKKKLFDLIRDPDCERCNLYKTAQCVCLIGDGPYPCDYMLVGEAPGFREDDIRKPFSGKAGVLLDKILASIEIERIRLYITNIIHCRPPENRDPKREEIEVCKYFLNKEIEYVKPKKIILMGRAAVIGVLGDEDTTIEELRKRTFNYKGAEVFVTYHPAAALRRSFLTKIIRTDLKRYIRGETKKEKEVDYKDISYNDFDLFRRGFGFDLETEGLDFTENYILSMSFSPKSRSSYFTASLNKFRNPISKLINNPEPIKIAHNLKFDLKFCLKHGFLSEDSLPKNNLFCTMVAFNILDENYLNKDLEHLATMFTTLKPWKSDSDFESPDKLRKRNLIDADAHRRLYNVFSKKLEKENLWTPFIIDMNMMKVLVSMEVHGVKINTGLLNTLTKNLEKEIDKYASKIKINPNSNQQMSKYLKSRGIKSYKRTTKGEPSWSKDVLESLSEKLDGEKKEALDNILYYRKIFGIKTKFLDSLPGFLDNESRVHPVFNQVKAIDTESGDEKGTVTGRLSCKNPNLMFFPRDREDLDRNINPRRLFIPTHPKGFILTADYDQIEVRVLAHVANIPSLIEALKKGGDIHRMIASMVLGKPPDKISKDERKKIKQVVFGIIYRISAWGLANKLDCSEDEAIRYIRYWFRTFPEHEEWIDLAENEILTKQEIANMFGRKRRLPGATTTTPKGRALIRQGCNQPMQGGAIDIMKIAMYRIFCNQIKEGMKSRQILNVHDELAIDGYPGEEKDTIQLVKEKMENPGLKEFGVSLKVPLKASLKIGPNWLDQEAV